MYALNYTFLGRYEHLWKISTMKIKKNKLAWSGERERLVLPVGER